MGRHGAVTFKGNPLTLVGEEVKVGVTAPEFDLACFGANGMQHITKADIVGKPTIISVVPSLDTPVCQVQTKTFNTRLAEMGDRINALTVSLDLPFAMNRFCGAEDIKAMHSGSTGPRAAVAGVNSPVRTAHGSGAWPGRVQCCSMAALAASVFELHTSRPSPSRTDTTA